MKKMFFTACFLICVFIGYSQQQPNPQLTELRNEKDSIVLTQKLAKLEASDKESDFSLLYRYYMSMRNSVRAQQISDIAEGRFPKGEFARSKSSSNVLNEKDPIKKEELLSTYKTKFPQSDPSMFYYDVAYAYAEKNTKNTSKVREYTDKITDKASEGMYKPLILEQLIRNGEAGLAEEMVIKLIEATKPLITSFVETPSTPGQRPTPNPRNDYSQYLNIYAKILYSKKKYTEVLVNAKEGYDNSNKKNNAVNATYTKALIANRKFAEAYPLMDEAYRNGMATLEIKENFEKAYVASKGTTEGYDTYLNSIQTSLVEKAKETVKRFKVASLQAPVFTLKDLNEKNVSLASLKGKVVILDFWATWCGPCKRSFPAMQLAVNKYKNNPDVVFLFIDTWETIDNPIPSVKQYIKDEKFTFQVLMDLKDETTKRNNVVDSYKVSGIPTKFIIDKNGDIMFRLTGFSGGEDSAVEELSAMIEMASK